MSYILNHFYIYNKYISKNIYIYIINNIILNLINYQRQTLKQQCYLRKGFIANFILVHSRRNWFISGRCPLIPLVVFRNS